MINRENRINFTYTDEEIKQVMKVSERDLFEQRDLLRHYELYREMHGPTYRKENGSVIDLDQEIPALQEWLASHPLREDDGNRLGSYFRLGVLMLCGIITASILIDLFVFHRGTVNSAYLLPWGGI